MRVSIPGLSGVLEGELWSPAGGGPPRAACAPMRGVISSRALIRIRIGIISTIPKA